MRTVGVLLLILFVIPPSALCQTRIRATVESMGESRTAQANVVLIVADDFGVDLVTAYGVGGDNTPCMPNLDTMASQGMLFRRCWSNPTCSPTRAQMLTGRHGFRTGIGRVIQEQGSLFLPLEEVTFAERLPAHYSSSAIGKWHLTRPENLRDPLDQGFDWFAGTILNLVGDCAGTCGYYDWDRNENGVVSRVTTYATSVTTDDAIQRLFDMPQPWVLYVAYHAPHAPLDAPPVELCPSECSRFCTENPVDAPQLVRAMAEALDTEIGRLLEALETVDPDAYVIFIGDNGTANSALLPPLAPGRGKGTMYEGGINVPLIVTGPDVDPGESYALVSSVDMFATVLEIAGAPNETGSDSLSFAHLFRGGSGPTRTFNFAERFGSRSSRDSRAVRDHSWKLIRRKGTPDELFDLGSDPVEQVNLFPPRTLPAKQAYETLMSELQQLDRASADFDGNGVIDVTDLAVILAHFGVTSGATYWDGDVNGDGAVTLTDLVAALIDFG